jgi:hypothetical protein
MTIAGGPRFFGRWPELLQPVEGPQYGQRSAAALVRARKKRNGGHGISVVCDALVNPTIDLAESPTH